MIRELFWIWVSVSLALVACGEDKQAGNGGGGSAGTTGGAGESGLSAAGGKSGAGGASGGTAGQGGASGSAGASGSVAGSPSAEPECFAAGDCTGYSDCCTCESLPAGGPPPPCNIDNCETDVCASIGWPPWAVSCAAGRCVLLLNCDHSKVTCGGIEPVCPPGELASVFVDCWGFCVKTSECTTVQGCADCDPSFYTCVRYEAPLGPVYHCVKFPTVCSGNATCQCLGPSVCTGKFSTCEDLPDAKGVSCSCPTC
jgi:hypothetical protein